MIREHKYNRIHKLYSEKWNIKCDKFSSVNRPYIMYGNFQQVVRIKNTRNLMRKQETPIILVLFYMYKRTSIVFR